jgi:hypothetical protein
VSERLVIKVDSPKDDPELMKVQDVFRHVLDLFELATRSESDPDGAVIWRLVSVSMNSPMTVVAEAASVRPNVDINIIARAQKLEFARNVSSLRIGVIPPVWSSESDRRTIRNLLVRNQNGIGNTNIDFLIPGESNAVPIQITQQDAMVASAALAAPLHAPTGQPKSQFGSIEGNLLGVGLHYQHPAIQLEERKTQNKIWCIVPDEFRRIIDTRATFNDVWSGRRVIVRGRISYDKDRNISRVEATEIRPVDPVSASIEDFSSPDFTGGLSAVDYLNRFREGSLD